MAATRLLELLFPWRELHRLKAVETLSREAELRRQRSFDDAGIGTWRRTVDGQAAWSPRLKEMFGFPQDVEPTFDQFLQTLRPEFRNAVDRSVHHAMRTGENFSLVYPVVLAGGGERWIEGHALWVRDETGAPLYIEGVATDITARVQLESELEVHRHGLESLVDARTAELAAAVDANRKLASRLQLACRAARLGTWVRDASSDSADWDDRMYALFGMVRRDTETGPRQEDWLQQVHPDDRPALQAELAVLQRRKGSTDRYFRVVSQAGVVRVLHATSVAEFDPDGRPTRMTGTCEDITSEWEATVELRQRKEAAEAADALKNQVIAATSHDLRQPLSAAALYLDLMSRSAGEGPMGQLVRKLGHSLDDLSSRLDSLLHGPGTHRDGPRGEASVESLDRLRAWLDEEFMDRFHAAGLRFSLHFPREAIGIRTDEPRLKAILRNLLFNARKFCSHGGVLVSCRRRRAGLLFQVWDTGIGIDSANLSRIFEQYYRVRNLSRESTWGQGLGLAICKYEAQVLGATLDCRSRKGRGSVFSLLLPADCVVEPDQSGNPLTSGDRPFTLPERMAGRHACVVEDSGPVRDSLSLMLRSWGMEVAAYADAAAALASPNLATTDFVLTDYRLPGLMDGVSLLDEIERRTGRTLRGLVLTGEADIDVLAARWAKPWPIIRKPFNAKTLAQALEEA